MKQTHQERLLMLRGGLTQKRYAELASVSEAIADGETFAPAEMARYLDEALEAIRHFGQSLHETTAQLAVSRADYSRLCRELDAADGVTR